MVCRPLIFLDPYPRTRTMVFPPRVSDALKAQARVVCHFGSRAPDELVDAILPDVSIIVGQTRMGKARLARAVNLKAILNVKGNWEPNIDYPEAQRRGIHVLSAAPAMAPAVAEYCLSQAINLGRGFSNADRLFREHREAYGIEGNRRAYTLYGARVGLVGFGNLGQSLVPLLEPFGCVISAYDPWLPKTEFGKHRVHPASLDDVIETSRFLFLLAGVTTENAGFLDRDTLSRIQDDASVILASRAEIIDFDALLEFAAAGAISRGGRRISRGAGSVIFGRANHSECSVHNPSRGGARCILRANPGHDDRRRFPNPPWATTMRHAAR